jgi:hypothetical protein
MSWGNQSHHVHHHPRDFLLLHGYNLVMPVSVLLQVLVYRRRLHAKGWWHSIFCTYSCCPIFVLHNWFMLWCNLQWLAEVSIPVFELFWTHVAPSLQIIHLLRFRVFTCSDKCTVMLAGWVCGWTNYRWHSGQLVIYLSIISVRRNIYHFTLAADQALFKI